MFAPEVVHQRLLTIARPSVAYVEGLELDGWRAELGARFREVLGVLPDPVPLDLRIEWQRERDGYVETRLLIAAEEGADIPCHLLVPSGSRHPVPVVICLQGHSPGMHISLGDGNPDGDRDFARQVVDHGWAAIALEQRCFGERADGRPAELRHVPGGCHHATHAASLLGRTMAGERVWDVSRAIDAIEELPELDATRIACMGNSGGGTVTWYAACYDSRITAIMPSCSICTYRDSIGSIDHCCDNYLPGALRHFDMPDLAGLVAPRPLVVVAGRDDEIFPIAGVRDAFDTIKQIYTAAGAGDSCALVEGAGGHRFYAADAWPVFQRLTSWS